MKRMLARSMAVAVVLVTFCTTGPNETVCEDWWVTMPDAPTDTVKMHLCEPRLTSQVVFDGR